MFWMALPILLAAGSTAEPANCKAAAPTQAAQFAPFYINREEIAFEGAKYAPYGLPRSLLDSDLVIVGKHFGVLVGVDATQPEDRSMIYLLHDIETCAYQPYQQM